MAWVRVAAQLPAEGRGAAPDAGGGLPHGQALVAEPGDLVPVFPVQVTGTTCYFRLSGGVSEILCEEVIG
jgi:hypothetical protein